ncbi:MAG: molybdopterin-guanine dinucleotide biosynthesis protein B [Coriobacteriales bacterium]|jgi:molybdopterin-guanine dinucleotide biosynthesis protein MobB|nr:molybdopterin-guanine dinucleotide biosynthesis protein B [Coriobacteriales bacterium]
MAQVSIPAVAFIGKQNSGKTTLLEKLIVALSSQGIRVATIKHHSHAGFEFDIEGKDSWRHRQAGSIHTVIAAPDQMASVRRLKRELSVQEIIDTLTFDSTVVGDIPQIILVEGYRFSGLPTIELFRSANPKDAKRDLETESNELRAVVTDIARVATQAQAQGLPVFTFDAPDPLARFLIKTFIEREERDLM